MKPSPYGPFPYTPITDRPRLRWPNDARVALWVVPNVEIFHLDYGVPGYHNERPGPQSHTPSVREWARRDYGNRVGVWRMFDVLNEFNIPATVSINSDVCDAHPQIVQAAVARGWDFMAHCQTNSKQLIEQAPGKDERQVIAETIGKIEKASGVRPSGWLGAGLAESWDTLDHLVAEGCKYVADWVNDDQPYLMDIGGKHLVSLPYSTETNDAFVYVHMSHTVDEFEQIMRRQFDVLYKEGAESGRVMAIGLHPYLTGQPHRIGALRSALEYICSHDGVWKATAAQIVDHYLTQVK